MTEFWDLEVTGLNLQEIVDLVVNEKKTELKDVEFTMVVDFWGEATLWVDLITPADAGRLPVARRPVQKIEDGTTQDPLVVARFEEAMERGVALELVDEDTGNPLPKPQVCENTMHMDTAEPTVYHGYCKHCGLFCTNPEHEREKTDDDI